MNAWRCKQELITAKYEVFEKACLAVKKDTDCEIRALGIDLPPGLFDDDDIMGVDVLTKAMTLKLFKKTLEKILLKSKKVEEEKSKSRENEVKKLERLVKMDPKEVWTKTTQQAQQQIPSNESIDCIARNSGKPADEIIIK